MLGKIGKEYCQYEIWNKKETGKEVRNMDSSGGNADTGSDSHPRQDRGGT